MKLLSNLLVELSAYRELSSSFKFPSWETRRSGELSAATTDCFIKKLFCNFIITPVLTTSPYPSIIHAYSHAIHFYKPIITIFIRKETP